MNIPTAVLNAIDDALRDTSSPEEGIELLEAIASHCQTRLEGLEEEEEGE